jgi:hypothetical protein
MGPQIFGLHTSRPPSMGKLPREGAIQGPKANIGSERGLPSILGHKRKYQTAVYSHLPHPVAVALSGERDDAHPADAISPPSGALSKFQAVLLSSGQY